MKTTIHGVALALGISWVAGPAVSQIVIGPKGSGMLTFDVAPAVQEWATQSFGGDQGGVGIVNAADLDTQVQSVTATAITRPLTNTSILPPSQNNYARWNSSGGFLQTRIGNNEFTVVMATLVNDTGGQLVSLGVSYELGRGPLSAEQVPGYRGYFSQTGDAGSWQVIPEFCTGSTGTVVAVLPVLWWAAGAPLYLLWADDNGLSSDGYFTLDNVQVTIGPALSIRAAGAGTVDISWPLIWWNHELQVSPSLSEPRWQTAVGSYTRTNGFHHLLLDASSGNRFFRSQGQFILPAGRGLAR